MRFMVLVKSVQRPPVKSESARAAYPIASPRTAACIQRDRHRVAPIVDRSSPSKRQGSSRLGCATSMGRVHGSCGRPFLRSVNLALTIVAAEKVAERVVDHPSFNDAGVLLPPVIKQRCNVRLWVETPLSCRVLFCFSIHRGNIDIPNNTESLQKS
jgi:hypothetical protein